MKTITRLLLGMIIFAVVSAIAPENAMAQKKAPPKLYKPPLRGAPVSRVGGGIPGPGDNKPSLHVLAPSHTGFTLVEQPDLYWYLSKRAQHPIEIIINDEINVEPMLEFRLNPPIQAGLHRIQLAKHGTRLLPGTTYEWFVSIVTDSEDPSQEIVAGDMIHHPWQVAEPYRTSRACSNPEQAIQTRTAFVQKYADTETLILGTHFAPPTALHIVSQGDAFRVKY